MNNKPVAWMCQDNVTDEWEFSSMKHCYKCEPLYTHTVKELTDKEIQEISHRYHYTYNPDYIGFARAILRKASEK